MNSGAHFTLRNNIIHFISLFLLIQLLFFHIFFFLHKYYCNLNTPILWNLSSSGCYVIRVVVFLDFFIFFYSVPRLLLYHLLFLILSRECIEYFWVVDSKVWVYRVRPLIIHLVTSRNSASEKKRITATAFAFTFYQQ